ARADDAGTRGARCVADLGARDETRAALAQRPLGGNACVDGEVVLARGIAEAAIVKAVGHPCQRHHPLRYRPDALPVFEPEEPRRAAAVVAEVQRCVGDRTAALAMAVLADDVAAPAAGDRHVQVHAVGPVDVDVGAVIAVQALGGYARQRECALEASDSQAQAVVRRPVTEVGLVEGDVAERGAGAGGRVTAQVDVRAVLLAAEAAGDPGAHGPVLAEAAFDRDAQAGVEGILVGLGAIARGAFAGEPAAAQVAAELPA